MTYAPDEERKTYISQETTPSLTSCMMGRKGDIKRQKAPGTAVQRTQPRKVELTKSLISEKYPCFCYNETQSKIEKM